MKKLLLCLAFLLPAQAKATETLDQAAFWASTALIVADWSTTRYMSQNYHRGYYEKGVLLSALAGRHPSPSQVDLFFLARLAAHYWLWENVDDTTARRVYVTVTIVGHGVSVHNNLQIGLRMRF